MKLRSFRTAGSTTLLVGLFLFSACRSSYLPLSSEGGRLEMNSRYDIYPDAEAVAILSPYKAKMDSIMTPVVGVAVQTIDSRRPNMQLANLIADALLSYASRVEGKMVDFAITNVGGVRSELQAGEITVGAVFEILPFENSLCVVRLNGKGVKALLTELAKVDGQGASNVTVVVKDHRPISMLVGGKEIEDERVYLIATLDYLSEGNDGMSSFLLSEETHCPERAIVRDLFLDYVKEQTAKGEKIKPSIDKRFILQ